MLIDASADTGALSVDISAGSPGAAVVPVAVDSYTPELISYNKGSAVLHMLREYLARPNAQLQRPNAQLQQPSAQLQRPAPPSPSAPSPAPATNPALQGKGPITSSAPTVPAVPAPPASKPQARTRKPSQTPSQRAPRRENARPARRARGQSAPPTPAAAPAAASTSASAAATAAAPAPATAAAPAAATAGEDASATGGTSSARRRLLQIQSSGLKNDPFIAAIRDFLGANAGKPVGAMDLWAAFEASTGAPVQSWMQTWTFQEGLPVVDAALGNSGELTLSQKRFQDASMCVYPFPPPPLLCEDAVCPLSCPGRVRVRSAKIHGIHVLIVHQSYK